MGATLLAVLAAIIVLLLLLASGIPVAFALALAGAIGIVLIGDGNVLGVTLGAAPMTTTMSYSLTIIPMFILMGVFVAQAGTGQALLAFASRALRRVPGGLGMAAIAACAGFAAVTGSSVATVATIGRIAVSEMARYGYQRAFAAGIVGVGGTLGVLIPPSILLVLYGVITGEPIGRLLIAGLLPGIFSAIVLAVYIGIRAVRHPELVDAEARKRLYAAASASAVPAGPRRSWLLGGRASAAPEPVEEEDEPAPPIGWGEQIAGAAKVGLLFAIVIGGMYTGLLTATEAAAAGAVTALVLLLIDPKVWREGLWPKLRDALRETASTTAMIFLILIGASIFATFLVRSGVPAQLSEAVAGLPVPGHVVVALILLLLIPLGMFLDGLSIMVITAPLTYPVVQALGFDGIWFGVLVVAVIELGLITPPVGVNAFVLASTVPKLGLEGAFRGLFPFFKVELFIIAVLFAFPWISTVLPETMR